MSDATTGVPAAKPSVRTMPNDSPPSDGAASTSAAASAARFSASPTRPSTVTPDRSTQQRRDLRLGGADDRQPDRDVLAQRLERAQQDRQALALDGLADEDDLQRVAGHAQARRGDAALGQPRRRSG